MHTGVVIAFCFAQGSPSFKPNTSFPAFCILAEYSCLDRGLLSILFLALFAHSCCNCTTFLHICWILLLAEAGNVFFPEHFLHAGVVIAQYFALFLHSGRRLFLGGHQLSILCTILVHYSCHCAKFVYYTFAHLQGTLDLAEARFALYCCTDKHSLHNICTLNFFHTCKRPALAFFAQYLCAGSVTAPKRLHSFLHTCKILLLWRRPA